jgi:hypothetical protein
MLSLVGAVWYGREELDIGSAVEESKCLGCVEERKQGDEGPGLRSNGYGHTCECTPHPFPNCAVKFHGAPSVPVWETTWEVCGAVTDPSHIFTGTVHAVQIGPIVGNKKTTSSKKTRNWAFILTDL